MTAEKIFYNAHILTQDKSNPVASAFAVSNQKIIAVGSNAEMLQLQTPNSKLENLEGKTVLPGFNDAHIHIWKVGNLLTFMLDLRGMKSIEEMQQRLSDYAKQNPDLSWIQARGFNEALFPDKRMPNKLDLDKVISDRPVSVIRTCAHQVIVNSKALELTGITKQSSPLEGGEIKRLSNGELAGHFTETALGLVMDKIPPYSADQYRQMILAAQEEFLKYGITAATDPAVMPDLLEVYKMMDDKKELKIRINAIPVRVPDGADHALPMPEKYASDYLKVDTVKFFSDGGLSGKTAALKHPYKNSNELGVLRLKKDFFVQLAREAQEHNFRIATHAIGDAAIDMVLDVYEEIFPQNKTNIKHRIEHLGFPSERNLSQMKTMKVSAVMQPIFIYELGKNFRDYLPDDYLQRVYPCNTVFRHGINLSFSTDAPVVKDFNPLKGIQAAMTRRDAEGFEIAAREKISCEAALAAYTIGSAIANEDENNRGSISSGKWADFIILDKNPLSLSEQHMESCKILATHIGGECLFRK